MTNPWRDRRVRAWEECVLRPLLERRAADTPGKVFARHRRRTRRQVIDFLTAHGLLRPAR